MKKTILPILLFLCAFAAEAITPFFYQGYLANGAPQTNTIFVSQYPANANQFSLYGTNIIFGGNVTNFTPTAGGFSSNALFPGRYRFYITNLNASFTATIADTTNYLSLGLYMDNPSTVSSGTGLTGLQIITNLMGMIPANAANTNDFARATPAGITNALGLIPANAANTNDFARMTADGLSLSISNLTSVKVITNGASVLLSYKTNGVPGIAFTNYPPGSLLVTTNGQLFQLTNSAWIAK